MRAVIGSYWVRGALTQDRPPIIVGCGATNQAVTNIIEAFIEAAHMSDDYLLARRWNPFVNSYGMFFASDSFAESNADKVKRYQGFQKSTDIKERCLFSLRESPNPFSPNQLPDLKAFYLQKAAETSELRGRELHEILGELRSLLGTTAIDVPEHVRRLIAQATGGHRRDVTSDQQISNSVMPLLGRQNDLAREVFTSFVVYVRDPSPVHVKDIMDDAECDQAEAARLLGEMLIDCTLRPHAFHIAARYWEGRFIETAAIRLHARSEENLKDALQRICMLAPCVVSTVNTLPKLFAVEHRNPDRPRHFAYGVADLLIMDESGQAVPEAGAACLALTKRAVVVGDLKQLEPIANIQPPNEIAILGRRNNLGSYNYLVDTFKAPASGSVLAMAQLASSYHDRFGNGVSLLFHYRCVKPIIAYCNRLSYAGLLKAKTKDGSAQWPPPLAWVEITSGSVRRGSSWVNMAEAKEIADWLRLAWPRIALENGGEGTIDKLVAVLSAFRPQIETLRLAIAAAFAQPPSDPPAGIAWPTSTAIERMTIGTVHALQGAERPIVIFSATVSAENATAPFFDSAPSILNVAVSRARKSFIYFGDPAHLFKYDGNGNLISGKPAAILGDHMRNHPLARRLYPLYLVIVEAPGKKQIISDILGKDYEVFATGGAIREIASGDEGLGFDRGLRPRWVWRQRGGKPLSDEFQKLAARIKDFQEVYIATDADMEGEAIAWHVSDALSTWAGADIWQKIKRVRMGDITRHAIMEAFAKAGTINLNIASAALARAIADKLIAEKLTRELNRKPDADEHEKENLILRSLPPNPATHPRRASGPTYIGRVQSGIIRLLYDQARKQGAHVQQMGRFRVVAKLGAARGHLILPEQHGREFRIDAPDIEAARRRLHVIAQERLPTNAGGYEHAEFRAQEKTLGPPPFLSTIEIMRRAVDHGLLPWDTMQALQNLYLGKIMQTDYFGEGEQ